MDGRKSIETRTWWTSYRGPLVIHAGLQLDADALLHFPDLKRPVQGAIVGLVDLVGMTRYTRRTFEADKDRHLCHFDFLEARFTEARRPLYGWLLENPRKLRQPLPWTGQRGLYTVARWAIEHLLPGGKNEAQPGTR